MMLAQDRGLTIVELILSLAILAGISAIIISAFASFGNYFALRTAAQDVHVALIDAREATLASKHDTVHGVHIEERRVVSFIGPVYDAATTTNRAYDFAGNVTATTSLLGTTGSTTDIVFTRLTGIAQASGTITLTEPRSGDSRVITILLSGLVKY